VRVPLQCRGGNCNGKLTLKLGRRTLVTGTYSTPAGRSRLTLLLTKTGRKALAKKRRAGKRGARIKIQLEEAGRPAPVDLTRRLRLR
jgi:hypothetical protein